MKLILLYNDFVGEKPGGVACGPVPRGNVGQRDGLDTHISGTAAETGRGKSLDFGNSKALGIVGMEGADELPTTTIAGDVVIDSLREEYPREGEVEEVELDFVERCAVAEVNDSVEGVAIESKPGVAIVEDSGTAVGEPLWSVGIVLTVGLVEEGDGTVTREVGLIGFVKEVVNVGTVFIKGIAHFVENVESKSFAVGDKTVDKREEGAVERENAGHGKFNDGIVDG